MKPGTIVYQGKTKKDNEIFIRYPMKFDLSEMIRYINTLSKERTLILFQGEQMNEKEEKRYLTSKLKKIKNHKEVALFVFHNEKLIGEAHITLKDKAEGHVGEFGISIDKDFRGEGIGKLLMRLIFEESKKNIPDLKICTLGVFANNAAAYAMYEKFGFMKYGKLPNGLHYKGEYIDHVYMYKKTSR